METTEQTTNVTNDFSLEDIYFKDAFTKVEDKLNLEVNNASIDCITSNNNKFSLDSDGNLIVNSISSLTGGSSNIDMDTVFDLIYPVGSIYMSINSIDPSTLFGGTWESWGSGRVPVGVDNTKIEFDSVEKIGGSNSHTHSGSSHKHTAENMVAMIGSGIGDAMSLNYVATTASDPNTGQSTVGTYRIRGTQLGQGIQFAHWTPVVGYTNTVSSGTTDSANNNSPYITCYMWKRIV